MNIPLVIKEVVDNDLCIGCGACVQACPEKALDVVWDDYGFLIASKNENQCSADGSCIQVCPFNPVPDVGYMNESELAKIFLKDAAHQHKRVGNYLGIYAGYSKKYRATSSSGGVATYIYDKLFEKNLVDYVVAVGESSSDAEYYEYKIISNKDGLRSVSKTRYHPVTLARVFEQIKKLDGRVAISGVACFIKAIRLAQKKDPILKERIVFLVGIICGGVKSKFFTEYLASKAGFDYDSFRNPEYRVKDLGSTATNYGFSCTDKSGAESRLIKMREVGDMWGTGMFKANACDYCDDVTTELADISLGDAWLHPYNQDGNGHNVIVSRSVIADEILRQGEAAGEVLLESLPLERFLESQQGSFNHRHNGLSTRMELALRAGFKVPPKRPERVDLPVLLKLIQYARRAARSKSLQTWRNHKNADDFEKRMKTTLTVLKLLTKASHHVRRLKALSRKRK